MDPHPGAALLKRKGRESMDTLWRNKRRDDKKRFFRALRNKREKQESPCLELY